MYFQSANPGSIFFFFFEPCWVDQDITLMTSFNLCKNSLIILCAYDGEYTLCTCMCMQRSGDKSCELVLSFHLCVGSGGHTQVARLVVSPAELSQWPRFLSLAYTEICFYCGRVNDCQEWSWSQRPTLETHDTSFPAPSFWSCGEWWFICGHMWHRALPPHEGDRVAILMTLHIFCL